MKIKDKCIFSGFTFYIAFNFSRKYYCLKIIQFTIVFVTNEKHKYR